MTDDLHRALEPHLLELFDRAALLDDSGGTPDLLGAYGHGVAALHGAAKQHGLKGIAYIGMLLERGLDRRRSDPAALDAAERATLANWPALVMSEVMAGPAMTPGWSLLHSLRSHAWFPDLPEHYVEVIEARLAQDAQRFDGAAPAVPSDPGVVDIGCGDEWAAIDDAPAAAANDDAVAVDAFDDAALNDAAFDAVAFDDDAAPPAPAAPAAAPTPSAVAPEELAVLREALVMLRDDFESVLAAPVDDAGREHAFETYTEQLENLVNAAAVVGLDGFQQVVEVGLLNAVLLRAGGVALTREQRDLVRLWPQRAIDYLEAPHERERATVLAAMAVDPAWPQPASADEVPGWVDAMTAVVLVNARHAVERPSVALAEHVDLALPADIDRNVLDSLLVELPQHAQAFSALVQRLAGDSATLQDLDDARRVAHTLKGASNTVGVKGVANLTHALEDILVALGRAERLPPRALAATLLEAADTLEGMSEALLAGDAAPHESVQVHQAVLDWANRIDRDGLPDADADADPAPLATTAAPEAPPSPIVEADDDEAAAETWLRVPASLVDTLLRLAGESSIVASQIQDRVERLGVDLGALRGGSRQFGQLAGELEQLVDVRGGALLSGGRADGELDALEMDQYNELHMLSRRIVESGADSREFSRSIGQEIGALRDLVAEKERVQLELQRQILRARMVEVASVAPRLQRAVRQAARVLGRSVQLAIVGERTLVDSQLLQRMLDPLMHLLRNAVDHGIEPAAEREAAGKPALGTITLSVTALGSNIRLRCEDDGRGLDLAAIRAKAAAAGLVDPQSPLSDAQALRLILRPGFSTRDEATLISGRGVGMDVVHRTVVDLRGTLELESEPGMGTRFEMLLPVQLSATQVMVSRSPRHVLALSVRGVEQILPAGGAVREHGEGMLSYAFDGDELVALRLETLLGLPAQALHQDGAVEAVMIVRDEHRERVALVVPELADSRNVVVKPLHAIVPRTLGVDGTTILGDGAVAPVLDLPDLLRGLHAAQVDAPVATAAAEARLPLALVVDDSVSVRRTMEQLMQDAGYEVVAARDGVDALGAVQRRRPDIVLVDLEMPRMNGIELTSALRNQSETRGVPVVMITSRFTDRHRKLAEEAGVDAFLTKPYTEAHLLGTMEQLLRRA